MVEHNIKRYVSAIVFSFLIILAILYFVNGLFFYAFLDVWGLISTSVTITTLLVVFFVTYAWKWRLFQGWLVPFPDLNGKWEGKIKSNYTDTGTSRKVEVQIKQNFLYIVVKLTSKESISTNFCGSFNIDKDRDVKQLIYSYFNEPDSNIRERSPLHYGTTKLDISKDNMSMTGEYWTTRSTRGSIKLNKVK